MSTLRAKVARLEIMGYLLDFKENTGDWVIYNPIDSFYDSDPDKETLINRVLDQFNEETRLSQVGSEISGSGENSIEVVS